ncbi:TerB N-terminal domain-containing protein [Paenibacillus campi]|uniref:TerB N-terminal domain-containing protein n=1 Tax=Paenibacillus campi TaxID=3106031 RepID=UPI002AFF3277|nr:TerB N-terminal domain-containing protein [Paenibacillus sp. SGZ-1014]
MTLTTPASFTDKSYIALLSFEEDRGFFLHISYGSHAIEPEKARNIQQLVMGSMLSGEQRWQLSAAGHSECLLRPDEAGKLYARLLRLLPGTLETDEGAPVQAYWDKHAAAVLAGSADSAAMLYEGEMWSYEHEEAGFMADVQDELPATVAAVTPSAVAPPIPYETAAFHTDAHTTARWVLEGRLEERDGVGQTFVVPMIEIGGIRYPALELSRRMGAAGAAILLDDGSHIETDLLREIGLGPMGRLADGTSLERNSRLTPQEIIQRGSERLRGPWEEMFIPELVLPDGNGGLVDHFEFLCRWGISGAMLGGVIAQADALGQFVAERIRRFPSCRIALIGRKALLNELRKRWSSMLEPYWQEATTGKAAARAGSEVARPLIAVPVSLFGQRSSVLPGGVDIAIYLEPDEMTADVTSKMYRALNGINARIRLSIFTEQELLDDPHLRTAQTSLLKLFHSVVREYAIADPEHPLTELPPPYTMVARRPAQPGLAQMARVGGFTELELGAQERGLRIPARNEQPDMPSPERDAGDPEQAGFLAPPLHRHGDSRAMASFAAASSQPVPDSRSKAERMEGLLQELSRQGIHIQRPPAFVQPEQQSESTPSHSAAEYVPHTAYAGAELELPHTEASSRRLYVPPALHIDEQLDDGGNGTTKQNRNGAHASFGTDGAGWLEVPDAGNEQSEPNFDSEASQMSEASEIAHAAMLNDIDMESMQQHSYGKAARRHNIQDEQSSQQANHLPFAGEAAAAYAKHMADRVDVASAHLNAHQRKAECSDVPILLSRTDGICYTIPAPDEPLPNHEHTDAVKHMSAQAPVLPDRSLSNEALTRHSPLAPAEQQALALEPLFAAYPPAATGAAAFEQHLSQTEGRSLSAIQSAEYVFALRAQEMAEQTETEAEFVPFMSYWPTYESMTWRQKRWYFYWRGEVRQQRYPATDLSYIFLLCYEVINGAGWQEPLDGYRLLLNVWRQYRHRFGKLDRYVPSWIVDFAQVHSLDEPLLELLLEAPRHVPSELVDLEWQRLFTASPIVMPLELLPSLLDYDLERSRFYVDEGRAALNEYIPKVLAAVDAFLERQQGSRLLGLFRPPVYRESERYLFRSAVYDSTRHGRTCTVRRLPLTEHAPLREFLTGIVKLTENELRRQLNVNGRLRIQPPVEPEIARLIERYIRRAFHPPEQQAAPRRVEIDPTLLERLQADSAVVRDMLTLREEDKEMIRQEQQAEQAYADWAAAAGQAKGIDPSEVQVDEDHNRRVENRPIVDDEYVIMQANVSDDMRASEDDYAAENEHTLDHQHMHMQIGAVASANTVYDFSTHVEPIYEELDELIVPGAMQMSDELDETAPMPLPSESSAQVEHTIVQHMTVAQSDLEPVINTAAAVGTNVTLLDMSELEQEWQDCLQAMQPQHIELLAAMLEYADDHALQAVAARYGTMAALLADEINELAMDQLGDLLLDDGTVMEEYRSLLDAIIMR